jgi:hypothetical protein
MNNKRNFRSSRRRWQPVIFILSITLIGFFHLQGSPQGPETKQKFQEFDCKKGLKLKIFKNTNIQFIHAQLIIYYREDFGNPAIPYLTYQNLFNRDVIRWDSPLISTLKKLGNDYEVEHRPDFLVIKINFLPEKMSLFMRFLKILYNFRSYLTSGSAPGTSYSERKQQQVIQASFEDSVSNFWKYFSKNNDWEKTIAFQIAYNHFFPGSIMGRTFITPQRLKNLTLDHIGSFYRSTYKMSNSMLIMKGNIPRPVIVYGLIEKNFSSTKKNLHVPEVKQKVSINPEKKVIIFNVNDNNSPVIFWFEAVSTYNNKNLVPSLVLNNILFLHPTGRLYLTARNLNINPIMLNTEIINHNTVSMICNIIHLRYRDIESFIMMAEREKKKLRIMRVKRREYLNTVTNLIGRLKVKTQDFENDVNIEKMKIPYNTQQVTQAGLNQLADEPDNLVIVIVGNARLILQYLTILRPQVNVIDFGL